MNNALYYGDNLAVLRESIASESVGLTHRANVSALSTIPALPTY